MRFPTRLVLLAPMALLWGCSRVVSVHSLYTPEEAKKTYDEPRLIGEWLMPELDNISGTLKADPDRPVHVSITKSDRPEAPYRFVCHWKEHPTDENEESYEYDFRLVPLDDAIFFDAVFVKQQKKDRELKQDDESDMAAVPGHLLGQVWIRPELVRFATLDGDWIAEHWPEQEFVVTRFGSYDSVTALTDHTADLRERLVKEAHNEATFRNVRYFCREGKDCVALAVEDQLSRTPDDAEALARGIDFYSQRGDFPRAISLLKHLEQTTKQENKEQASEIAYELGKLLLLSRDFAAAREVLKTVTTEPSDDEPTSVELNVRSYFLEGDYPGTVRAAKAVHSPNPTTASDSIILAYFALHRMGKAKDAEAFLREQTATFRGDAQEQLFLLKTSGRLTDDKVQLDADRDAYYSALSAIRQGDAQRAESLLKPQIARSVKDNLLALASQIELERLSQPAGK